MLHPVPYGISWDPVCDNGILWPCLSSGSRKHKSVSAHDRSRRYITYLWCTARNKTTELETSKQTAFMSIRWCNRYDQSPKHRSILLPQPWSTHSSLSLEKRQYSLDFSKMLLFFKALTFLRGTLWIQAWGCQRAQNASSLLSSHLQKNLPSENLTQRLTWHIYLIAPIYSLGTAYYSHPIISDTQDYTLFHTDTVFFFLFVSTFNSFCIPFPQLGPTPPILNPCSS